MSLSRRSVERHTMTNYFGPPPPHRVGGVQVDRRIPVVPNPGVRLPELPEEDQDQIEYFAWKPRYGGTFIEFLVFRWLVKKANLTENEDFIYQSATQGGRSIVGGAVVDFELPLLGLAFRVQGEFFHLEVHNGGQTGIDFMQKTLIESQREIVVVDLYERDLLERLNTTMEYAMRGLPVREVRE